LNETENSQHLLLDLYEERLSFEWQGSQRNATTAEAEIFDAWVRCHVEQIEEEVNTSVWPLHERWLLIRDLLETRRLVRVGNMFAVPAMEEKREPLPETEAE
jgi:hypothetical protein